MVTYDYRAASLKAITPQQVLAYLKKQGFEPALNKPKERHLPTEKRFRDGVRVIKHRLKPGWVAVEYHYNGGADHTPDEWVEGAKRVFEALERGPFQVNWVGDHVGATIEVVGK